VTAPRARRWWTPCWRQRRDSGLSSAHLLFVDETDRRACAAAGWMLREGVQFHWTQDAQRPYRAFADLLARLQRDKRKKIQQERRRVAEQGVVFTVHEGADIDDASCGTSSTIATR
jgi:uncharacterized protein